MRPQQEDRGIGASGPPRSPGAQPAVGSPSASGHRPEVTVREIAEGDSLKPFIDLAWRYNAGDPNWVAPLRMTVAAALDRSKHPFHQHAEIAYLVAWRGGEPVGRIAAIVNRLHNETHSDRVGFFGLFECEDDLATAAALFDAAADWLHLRGMERMRGPMNFSTNEEVASPGVLVEGFEYPPALMMGHNPRYYAALHEAAGFQKCKDVLAFLLDEPDAVPDRWRKNIDRVLQRHDIRIRTLEMKRFWQDLAAIKEVYNSAWSANWGFVPMTDPEFEHLAKEFKPFVDPELCLIAETPEGEPIGFFLCLPNLNEILQHIPSGRLLPFGIFKFLRYRRSVTGIRAMTLGFKPRFQHAGLGIVFYLQGWLNGVRRGYVWGETSWILEDNTEMVRAIERMGGQLYRRYRIFERGV